MMLLSFSVAAMTLFGALGAFFFKQAASATASLLSLLKCRNFYFGGAFYVAGALLNVLLLCKIDYSVLYPMTAITYIWTALISRKLLGESISRKKIAGILAIVLGVLLLNCA